MQHLDEDSSFQRWVGEVFSRPAGASCVCCTDRNHAFDSPHRALAWRARLFEEAGALLGAYADEQIAQGIEHLTSHAHTDDLLSLSDGRLPLDVRVRCLESFVPLFREVIAPRTRLLDADLASLRAPGTLGRVAFMWWDAMDLYPGPDDPDRRALDECALGVMRTQLALGSHVCTWSGLHGLGHWRRAYPRVVEPILDAALASAADWPPLLRDYAHEARWHHVQ